MGDSHHSCQLTAHVVNHSRSNMSYHAQKRDIHRFDTMSCGISLLHYCQKPAMELLLNPPFSLSPVRGSYMLQRTLKMVLASILLQMDFGVAHSKEPFLMSGYSILLLSQTVTPLSRQLTIIMRTSKKKKRHYKKRIREVERSSFTALFTSD